MIPQLIVNGLIAGGIYTLVALGFTLIYRTSRFFNFAHGAVYALGAYAAYSFAHYGRINHVVSFFLGTAIAGISGIAFDRMVFVPLRKRKAPPLVFLIASFGVFVFIQNLIQLLYGAQILSFRPGNASRGHDVLGAVITNTQIVIIFSCASLFLALWLFVRRSKLGKAMRAVSDDPLAASSVGIPPEKIILTSFAIGSVLAGAAAILISLETYIEPTMGLSAILKGIVASIIGGLGAIPGAFFGGFVLGLAENIGVYMIPSQWKDSIAFGILLFLMMIRPAGLSREADKERL